MYKKAKFYLKENIATFLVLLITVAINAFRLIMFKYDMDNGEVAGNFDGIEVSSYFSLFVVFLNYVTICFLAVTFITNSVTKFTKARKFKFIFESLDTVRYIFNPILILVMVCILILSDIIRTFSFYQYEIVYEGFSNFKDLLSSYTYIIGDTVDILFNIYILYFMLLILYKQLDLYSVKYYNSKQKTIFVVLHIFAAIIGSISLEIFALTFKSGIFSSRISDLPLNNIYISDMLYLYDHFITSDTFTFISVTLVMVVVLFVVLKKNLILDKNSVTFKLRKIILTVLFVFMITVSYLKNEKLLEIEDKIIKEKVNGAHILSFEVGTNPDTEYNVLVEEIDATLEKGGVSNYKILINGYMSETVYVWSEKVLVDEKSKDLEVINVVLYDLPEDVELVIGRLPEYYTEIVVTNTFAKQYMKMYNYDSIEDILNLEYDGHKIVGIVEDADEVRATDQADYLNFNASIIYTDKSFNEKAYMAIVDKVSDSSYLGITVTILSEEDDYNFDFINYNYQTQTDMVVLNDDEVEITNTTFVEASLIEEHGNILYATSLILYISLLYLTSSKERGAGKNV